MSDFEESERGVWGEGGNNKKRRSNNARPWMLVLVNPPGCFSE